MEKGIKQKDGSLMEAKVLGNSTYYKNNKTNHNNNPKYRNNNPLRKGH